MTWTKDSIYDERVQDGAAFLDSRVGETWHNDIDLSTFNITDPCLCVLGQLYSFYSDATDSLGLSSSDDLPWRKQDAAHAFGFFENTLDDDMESTDSVSLARTVRWHRLERAWFHLIAKRQKEES